MRVVTASTSSAETDRLLNLIDSRLRRKEIALAEELAEELLARAMDGLVRQKAAGMRRLNRFLLFIMQLLLLKVFASLVCMVMDIQPLLGLTVFTAGVIMIALLIVLNYYLFDRFCRAIHMMTELYEKENRRFTDLLLDRVRVNDNPETALAMFRLSMMR